MLVAAIIIVMMMTMLLTPPSYSSVFTGIRGKPEPKDASSIPRKIWQIFSTPADFDGPGPFRIKSQVRESAIHLFLSVE